MCAVNLGSLVKVRLVRTSKRFLNWGRTDIISKRKWDQMNARGLNEAILVGMLRLKACGQDQGIMGKWRMVADLGKQGTKYGSSTASCEDQSQTDLIFVYHGLQQGTEGPLASRIGLCFGRKSSFVLTDSILTISSG
jgi:hypothetical protein